MRIPSFMSRDISRRGFLKAGAAGVAFAAANQWSSAYADDPNVLNYLSWPGNADPYLIADFEKENNVKVRIKEYVGGDQMLAVINQSPPGSFDVVLADAEYMHLLHASDFIEPLDPDDYPIKDFWPEFQKFPLHWFDGKLYGVMTDFGYLGLSYNTNTFRPEEVKSYAAMWSEKAKGKVGFFDWYLPSMGSISLSNGNLPPFDISEEKFEAVKEKLFTLKPQASGFYTIADIFSSMTNGQAQLVPGIGEWITLGLRLNGVPVDTIIPEEGGLQWTESLSIVKGTPKKDLARKFIQYTTSPQGQVKMATKVDNKKSIPSIAGWKLLNETMPKDAEILRMRLDQPNVMDEYKAKKIQFRQLPSEQSIEDWNDVWSEFKSL
ncbi:MULTISPECIES: ABC transporter substrate-binding protein [Rhizobium]|uniref:Spermidine/putrescine transport system substrate-binding protein n=1 Tax=Rhizobium esperanzae TaxID=1967781 RepID=A0A7W6US75_9HYPH|nr:MULTISPECIES: spermidine/putrescine ABC transporter substrate-binding protein [Rhizobium]MBB4443313.1 spermidine/putrescine transport system substrate-binding protein [Rhizobium esperanzae]MDH6206157.1 spermidine/putrescine transport system substrate-binding protein [Rhizobium leguminosarum]